MFNWVLTRISEFCVWLFDWLWLLARSGSWPESDPLVPIILILSLLLGSACLAATIAELRGRKLFPHFCLGFLIPVVYPIFAVFGLKKKVIISAEDNEETVMDEASAAMNQQMETMLMKRELKTRGIDSETATFEDFEALRQEKQAAEEATSQAQDAEASQPEHATAKFDKAFFESIAVDAAGNRLGPYVIVMYEGTELLANYITGVHDELISCEVTGRDGKARTVRVRYENVGEVRNA